MYPFINHKKIQCYYFLLEKNRPSQNPHLGIKTGLRFKVTFKDFYKRVRKGIKFMKKIKSQIIFVGFRKITRHVIVHDPTLD
jgi:hypothetical protein